VSKILAALRGHAKERPDAVFIRSVEGDTTYGAFLAQVETLAAELRAKKARVVALMLDNHPAWAAVDLACMAAGVTLVPIPLFFSDVQRKHAINDAQVDIVLTNIPHKFDILNDNEPYARDGTINVLDRELQWMRPPRVGQSPSNMEGIAKVTYTSGTTAQPKGVMLTQEAMDLVVVRCREFIDLRREDRPLALVPLSVLMENLLGMHTSIIAGCEYVIVPMPALGFRGSMQIDFGATLEMLRTYEATQMICTPQVLQNMIIAMERSGARLPKLKFCGLGGAPVSKAVVERGMAVGLPVYQGWGLSEAGSVLTLNVPGANKPGSAGKLIGHAKVRRAEDGELLVSGPSLLAGYTGQPPREKEEWLATGDLGEFDEEGYLFITGRKKAVIINSYGRNLSPEWVESELTTRPQIVQAVVHGDSRPFLSAIVFSPPNVEDSAIKAAIDDVNWDLPDYAQVKGWIRATEPFSMVNDQLTGTGKPRREVIYRAYAERLDRLYEEQQPR
jgi:long-subunit acyl-CoA synthetase (AMP-forming)